MAEKFCERFFYPEKLKEKCSSMSANGSCKHSQHDFCIDRLYLSTEEYAILDNLRIVKAQNAEILAYIRGNRRMK